MIFKIFRSVHIMSECPSSPTTLMLMSLHHVDRQVTALSGHGLLFTLVSTSHKADVAGLDWTRLDSGVQ